MKRETLLRHMGSATDSDISYEDPNLLQKLEARYDLFKSGITNKEFKDGLERAEAMFPKAARQEILGKLQAQYVAAWNGDTNPNVMVAQNGGIQSPVTGAPPGADRAGQAGTAGAGAESSTGAGDASGRDLASGVGGSAADFRSNAFLGMGNGSNQEALKDFLSANPELESISIFQRISKRYRTLTPALQGKTAMAVRP